MLVLICGGINLLKRHEVLKNILPENKKLLFTSKGTSTTSTKKTGKPQKAGDHVFRSYAFFLDAKKYCVYNL